jgi:hypothetical protein
MRRILPLNHIVKGPTIMPMILRLQSLWCLSLIVLSTQLASTAMILLSKAAASGRVCYKRVASLLMHMTSGNKDTMVEVQGQQRESWIFSEE